MAKRPSSVVIGSETPPRSLPLTFHHTNGWTMSVAHNIGPGYSVVAYPTALGQWTPENAFTWEGGSTESWVSSLSGLVTDAQEVMNALPPTAEQLRRR